jgi:hypothetical protein
VAKSRSRKDNLFQTRSKFTTTHQQMSPAIRPEPITTALIRSNKVDQPRKRTDYVLHLGWVVVGGFISLMVFHSANMLFNSIQ